MILAPYAPASLMMLIDPTPLETQILSCFAYQPNDVRLHTDTRVMPHSKRCWASWNYRSEGDTATTHYWMNSLQAVSDRQNYFVSLNSADRLDSRACLRELNYEHPLFDRAAIAAQKRLPELLNAGRETATFFCGAWTRYGFHEDGLLSAVNVAGNLLGGDPWTLR